MKRFGLALAIILNIASSNLASAQTENNKVNIPTPNNGQTNTPAINTADTKVQTPSNTNAQSPNTPTTSNSAPISIDSSKPTDSNSTTSAPTLTPQAQPADKPLIPTTGTISTTYSDPDYSLVEKFTNSLNKKNYDDFSSVFSNEFEFITHQDKSIKTTAELKRFWDEIFAPKSLLESATFVMTPGKIISPTQGFAYVTIPYKLTTTSETFDGVMTAIMKFEQNSWKISQLQMSSHSLTAFSTNKQATLKCSHDLEEYKKSTMGLAFPAFLGFIIGIAVMYFFKTRKQPLAS